MNAATRFVWNTSGLESALQRGFIASVKAAQAVAQSKNPAPSKIGVRIPRLDPRAGNAIITGTGKLAHIFEEGREGGYEIRPKGRSRKALHFSHGDGGFASGAIGGPMAARPYMRPAMQAWPALYGEAARTSLAAAGFRALR